MSCSTLRGAPDYAVVADAVELAKAHGRAGHGLVNAVLRRATREGADALLDGLATTRPSAPRSSTPTPSGSRGCGGRRSAPSRHAR